jgi:ABC-type antimicrobial peptide transport system permease subunit
MFATYSQVSVQDVPIQSLEVKFKPNTSQATISLFYNELKSATGGMQFDVYNELKVSNSKITKIMNYVFNTIIALTMFLCFFALSANMSANLYEQTKEIGVLRSIGFTKMRIRMLYFYESLVIVLASCTTGVMIGFIVGYTMIA